MNYDKRVVPDTYKPEVGPENKNPTAPQSTGPQKERKDEAPCVARGRKSWQYLKSIGLGASLVIVGNDDTQSAVGRVNDALTTALATSKYIANNQSFDTVIKGQIDALVEGNGHAPRVADGNSTTGPSYDPSLINIWASTSVAMQMMQHLGLSTAQKILGYRLSGGANLKDSAKRLAEQKFIALCGIIDTAKKANRELKGVVLFNYRIGDVNTQHDSNPGILKNVHDAAVAMGYMTIVIPQMSSREYNTLLKEGSVGGATGGLGFIFDMLDLAVPKAPFMDNTAKAYFWHLVASFLQGAGSPLGGAPLNHSGLENLETVLAVPQRPRVVGLVGGRSGSTDLPAFVGLRVYSWEEPVLTALGKRPGPGSDGDWSASFYRLQGPQAIRLFNQYPMVVTGFLNEQGFKKLTSGRKYTELNTTDGTLTTWLAGRNPGPIPPLLLPNNDNQAFLKVRTLYPSLWHPTNLLLCRNSLTITSQRLRRSSLAASRSVPFRSPRGRRLPYLPPSALSALPAPAALPARVVAKSVSPRGLARLCRVLIIPEQ